MRCAGTGVADSGEPGRHGSLCRPRMAWRARRHLNSPRWVQKENWHHGLGEDGKGSFLKDLAKRSTPSRRHAGGDGLAQSRKRAMAAPSPAWHLQTPPGSGGITHYVMLALACRRREVGPNGRFTSGIGRRRLEARQRLMFKSQTKKENGFPNTE